MGSEAPARPDHHERAILLTLSCSGGWTAGQIARGMGHQDARKHGAIIRHRLLDMEKCGWVGRLDDAKPTAWVRTTQGTEAINA